MFTEITAQERLLTTEEIASFLAVNPQTVLDWIKSGQLPAFNVNRTFRITYEDFQTFVKSHMTRPAAAIS